MSEDTKGIDPDEAPIGKEGGSHVSVMELDDLSGEPPVTPRGLPSDNINRVLDVSVSLTARVGMVRKTISEVMDLVPGSIIDMGRPAGEPIDLTIGDKLVARGEIVVVDDRYGIRVVEVVQGP